MTSVDEQGPPKPASRTAPRAPLAAPHPPRPAGPPPGGNPTRRAAAPPTPPERVRAWAATRGPPAGRTDDELPDRCPVPPPPRGPAAGARLAPRAPAASRAATRARRTTLSGPRPPRSRPVRRRPAHGARSPGPDRGHRRRGSPHEARRHRRAQPRGRPRARPSSTRPSATTGRPPEELRLDAAGRTRSRRFSHARPGAAHDPASTLVPGAGHLALRRYRTGAAIMAASCSASSRCWC